MLECASVLKPQASCFVSLVFFFKLWQFSEMLDLFLPIPTCLPFHPFTPFPSPPVYLSIPSPPFHLHLSPLISILHPLFHLHHPFTPFPSPPVFLNIHPSLPSHLHQPFTPFPSPPVSLRPANPNNPKILS